MNSPPSKFSSLLSSLSSNANERGTQFEREVCEWFLRNDPRYRERFARIIPYREWEGGGSDLGTDLIAIEYDGTVWAIQAKCYDDRYQVTKADIDRFSV